jgi:2-(1,2-epoxy-1,2-dihydrophenyl)acetyl-CoA isomerase
MATLNTEHRHNGSDLVLTRLEDGALWITMNRPEAANALRADQRDRIIELIESASGDSAVRVVVLAANGRHFCGGMDLTVPVPQNAPVTRQPGAGMLALFTGAHRMIESILDCFKPVMAVVQGPAAGLGLYMALACDIVVASEQAAFVETFTSRAMVLHCGGAHLLPVRMGMQRAKEFVFFGQRLTAQEALDAGLVNRVVPAGELAATAQEMAQRLATGPTAAIGLSKRLLNRSVGTDRSTSLSEEAMAMEINGLSQDMAEGRRAFVERRPPLFVGR